ncbi:hypothetical protein Gotri_002163 [Gossypium trilobum]|uniref:RNase H type-1 domain-containing protein n=1 Tax=Gossypium trilobum TaxID=34281 RepID=A0A7J9F7D2_9ROSI|nr:hypothetical protein [Gossypium trilobum]
MTGRDISKRIQSYLTELDGLEERTLTLSVDRGHIRPERNMRVRIYFDAAFDKRSSRSVSRLVVLDFMGEILASKIVMHNAISSLLAAKALAGLQAIQLGISMGFNSLAIVGDSRTIDFQFVHRLENECAHTLAHEA